jgi:hypothetical protein
MNSEFGFVHRVQLVFSFICSFVLESTTFGNVCSLSITVLSLSLVIVTSPFMPVEAGFSVIVFTLTPCITAMCS